jgi:putative DNA primase/helicase
LEQRPYLLGTPKGTVDLRTGELQPPRPQDAISKSTSVAPLERPDCPIFLRFLDETFSGDGLVIKFVQQFLGYCLTGDTREQIFAFGHGGGGNGKGVLVNTVKAILGDYAAQGTMDSLTAQKHSQHSTDIAMLAGSRLVIVPETERGPSEQSARSQAAIPSLHDLCGKITSRSSQNSSCSSPAITSPG